MKLLRLDGTEGPLVARRRVRRERPEMVVVPLQGGSGAMLGRARLVSLLTSPADGGTGGRLRRWLERRQARRSLLLLAAERQVAVTCARRWRLDLARIRLVPDLDLRLDAILTAELRRIGERGGRPWHSA